MLRLNMCAVLSARRGINVLGHEPRGRDYCVLTLTFPRTKSASQIPNLFSPFGENDCSSSNYMLEERRLYCS